MYNVAEAEKLLADLPPDHGKALEEITASLETVAATPGFPLSDRIGVLKLLDETGQKRESAALSEFLRSDKIKDFERRVVTVMADSMTFEYPVKVGDLLLLDAEVSRFDEELTAVAGERRSLEERCHRARVLLCSRRAAAQRAA